MKTISLEEMQRNSDAMYSCEMLINALEEASLVAAGVFLDRWRHMFGYWRLRPFWYDRTPEEDAEDLAALDADFLARRSQR